MRKFVDKNKWYFKNKETEKKMSEGIYLGLGVAFLLTLIDFTKYLNIKSALKLDLVKLGILILLIAIYGWSTANEETKKKEKKNN